eukprot:3335676-Heterocapsa_arctica.AAC.1
MLSGKRPIDIEPGAERPCYVSFRRIGAALRVVAGLPTGRPAGQTTAGLPGYIFDCHCDWYGVCVFMIVLVIVIAKGHAPYLARGTPHSVLR